MLRVWRVVRLVHSLLASAQGDSAKLQALAEREARRAESGTEERSELEDSLQREVEARTRTENLVKSLRDENETLTDALNIAALSASERQLLDADEYYGEDLLGAGETGSEDEGSDGGGGGGEEEEEVSAKFVISADGTFVQQ